MPQDGTDLTNIKGDGGDWRSLLSNLTSSLGRLHQSQRETEATAPPPEIRMPTPPPTSAASDPILAFGQPAMALAVFGSLLTKRPATTAIMAAAGVMKSTGQQDQEILRQNYNTWKVESENLLKMAKYQQDQYRSALAKESADARSATADATVMSHALHDLPMIYALQHGGIEEAMKLYKHRGQSLDAAEAAQERADQRLVQHRVYAQWESENQDATAAERLLARDAIFNKKAGYHAEGGKIVLDDSSQAREELRKQRDLSGARASYATQFPADYSGKRVRPDGSPAPTFEEFYNGEWRALSGKSPAKKPAKGEAAAEKGQEVAPPDKSSTALPPVSERKAGNIYPTPRGPMRWTGTGWIAPTAPWDEQAVGVTPGL